MASRFAGPRGSRPGSPDAASWIVKLRGPYGLWHHHHRFAESGQGTVVRDEVDYALPLGDLAHRLLVRRDLERIFAYRHQAVPELLASATTHATLAAGEPGVGPG